MEEERKNNSSTGSVIGILIVLGIIWWFFWGREETTWQGFYYPNAGNLTNDIKSPIFKSLDDCRQWVSTMVYKYNPDGTGYDYECGKNCRIKDSMSVLVCEETVR